MPPVQPSLRGSLLTGASALALSISPHAARAQAIFQPLPPRPGPTWTVWIEASAFQTGGQSFNIQSLPNFGSPFFSFKPPGGWEGAAGFDYHQPFQPWHFVFDIRGGISKTLIQGSRTSSSSVFTTTTFFG